MPPSSPVALPAGDESKHFDGMPGLPADPTAADCQAAYRRLIMALERDRVPHDHVAARVVQMWQGVQRCDKFTRGSPLWQRAFEHADDLSRVRLYKAVLAYPRKTLHGIDAAYLQVQVLERRAGDLRTLYPLLTLGNRAEHWFTFGKFSTFFW